jgi:glycosyltransferase involved in cell wall biosynthesis
MAIAQNAVEAIRAFRPTDVVLQYTSQMWDGWRFGSPAAAWLAARLRRTGARTVLIAHELYVPWRARPDLSAAALSQRLLFGALLKSYDLVFVTTSTRAALIAPYCRLLRVAPPRILRVGPNVMPIKSSRERDRSRSSKIGLFSTAAAGKRFDVVLDAFQCIALEIPAVELVLMGDLGSSDQPRVRKILQDISQHPARDHIRTTGRLSLEALAGEISDLDLYLFPMDTGANTRSGTLPVALGSGIPTVAINGVDTDSALFRDGETLSFAADMSGAAFAEASLRLLRDPALAKRVGEGGRRLYETHLSWERSADQLLADS